MNLKDPRTQLSYLLILIFLSAVFYYKDILLIKNLFIAVVSTVVFDFLFLKLRKIEFFPPAAAITSGLIISLLISTTAPFYEIIVASGLAMLSKNFTRFFKGHVFNPAGFGVLMSSLIFAHSVSWWGVSFQHSPIFILILLSPIIVSVLRMRRHKIILSFLSVYFLLTYSLKSLNFLDPTVLFFSTVMLPEPQTTPNKTIQQIAFGAFVAFLSFLPVPPDRGLFLIPHGGYDPLIFALLAGNLIFYRLK